MKLTITSVDHAPDDLYGQLPFTVDLIKKIPGDDRPDYWIGKAKPEIKWLKDKHEQKVSHLVLAARLSGTRIRPGAKGLPVGIAYVTDESLLADDHLNFKKCAYVAIGMAHETTNAPESNPLKKLWQWAIFLFGIALSLIGAALVAAYVFEAIVARMGEPDQSLLFWYLPILFFGFLGLAAGLTGAVWGFRALQRANRLK
jgi:hypothetical protein